MKIPVFENKNHPKMYITYIHSLSRILSPPIGLSYLVGRSCKLQFQFLAPSQEKLTFFPKQITMYQPPPLIPTKVKNSMKISWHFQVFAAPVPSQGPCMHNLRVTGLTNQPNQAVLKSVRQFILKSERVNVQHVSPIFIPSLRSLLADVLHWFIVYELVTSSYTTVIKTLQDFYCSTQVPASYICRIN